MHLARRLKEPIVLMPNDEDNGKPTEKASATDEPVTESMSPPPSESPGSLLAVPLQTPTPEVVGKASRTNRWSDEDGAASPALIVALVQQSSDTNNAALPEKAPAKNLLPDFDDAARDKRRVLLKEADEPAKAHGKAAKPTKEVRPGGENYDKDGNGNKDKDNGRNKDKDKDYAKDKDNGKNKEKDKDNAKDKDKGKNKGKNKDMVQGKGKFAADKKKKEKTQLEEEEEDSEKEEETAKGKKGKEEGGKKTGERKEEDAKGKKRGREEDDENERTGKPKQKNGAVAPPPAKKGWCLGYKIAKTSEKDQSRSRGLPQWLDSVLKTMQSEEECPDRIDTKFFAQMVFFKAQAKGRSADFKYVKMNASICKQCFCPYKPHTAGYCAEACCGKIRCQKCFHRHAEEKECGCTCVARWVELAANCDTD